jgi:hypothetical protein
VFLGLETPSAYQARVRLGLGDQTLDFSLLRDGDGDEGGNASNVIFIADVLCCHAVLADGQPGDIQRCAPVSTERDPGFRSFGSHGEQ